MRHCQTQK